MTTEMATESEVCRTAAINEARLEQLLSEKLMQGYVLMESSCPKCSTPLVKNHHMVPKTLFSPSDDDNDVPIVNRCILLPAESFDQPFRPVDGVPVCVACKSHVITQETEVAILEHCDSMKDKGSIYVALNIDGKNKNEQQQPEIINLEDVAEEDVGDVSVADKNNNYRGQNQRFHVDIQTTSFDDDGNSAFELTFSPRAAAAEEPGVQMIAEGDDEEGDEAKPIVIEDPSTEPIFVEDPAILENIADIKKAEDEKEVYSMR